MAKKPRTVIVNDRMQRGYTYALVAPVGRGFAMRKWRVRRKSAFAHLTRSSTQDGLSTAKPIV